MEISRRAFIQTTLAGGATLSAFGFDVAPVYAQAKTLKIARTTETRSTCPYCSVSCGVIIHTLGDKAKNAIAAGGPRRRRSRSSHQPRHALSQGRVAPAGHPERSPAAEAAGPASRVGPLGRHRLGSGDRRDRAGCVKKTRDETFIERDARGRVVNRCEGIAWTGGCTDTNEFNYLVVKTMRSLGVVLPGKPGPGLTRAHGLQFGAHIRTRRNDQRLDRHQEHRHDVDHGWQPGREPSVRLQVADRGEARTQRQDDRRRSALHAHRRRTPISSCRFARAPTSPSSAA